MWKQLEWVFVVERVLSCHWKGQLLMGNMKPGWAEALAQTDFKLWPQTLLSVCWSIDNWDLSGRIIWNGGKGSYLVYPLNKMLVIRILPPPKKKRHTNKRIFLKLYWSFMTVSHLRQWHFGSLDPKHVPLIMFLFYVPFMGNGLLLLSKLQKCLVSEMSFRHSLISHVVHFKQANIVDMSESNQTC